MKHRKRISQVPLPEPVHGKSKKIKVWENGSSECHVFNINPKDFRTWGIILHHITHILHPTFGAVKKLIELKTKKEVKDFDELDPKQKYIATGFNEKLKEPIRGYKTHAELLKEEREATQRSPMYSETGRVTHNWEFLKQTEKLRNTVVYVALNGNTIPPQKAVFKESEMEDTNLINSYCSKMLGMPDGISHFCTIYGRILKDPKDFQHGYLYVAVPYGESFIKIDYMALFKKHYNYKKTKKPKIPTIIVKPHSSVHSRCSRRTVKIVGKSGKSRKSGKTVTDNTTKTKIPSYKTKSFDSFARKKNKLTNVDSKLASEKELKITYYSKSEQDHIPSFKARTVSSIPHQKFVPKHFDIRKPSFHTSTVTLSPEELIRSNEAGCMSDEDRNNDETTVDQENYERILYEQQQFEKANTDKFCKQEPHSIPSKIIQEPSESKQTVRTKVCNEKKYHQTKMVQDCQQLVFGLWYNQATNGNKNETVDVDNIGQNNHEMQLINYQEPLIGVTLKLPDGGKQPHPTGRCEQAYCEKNTVTWRELGEKEQKQKKCSDEIIYEINKSNTWNSNDHVHPISGKNDSTVYEQIGGQASEELRQENDEPEEEETDRNGEYESFNKHTNEHDSLNSFKSDDNLNYYYVKLVNEGNQTMFRKIESREKYVQSDMRRQSCGHKPRSRKCERGNILSSVTEPILTLSQQIMEADSSIAVTYHAQSRQRTKKSLPRSFTVKEDQSDLQRNVESNKRAVHLDEYCKKSKKTLSQLILSVSKTIKTYQDILKEVEKDIADDPIAQRLMRKIKKGSCAATEETRKSTCTKRNSNT